MEATKVRDLPDSLTGATQVLYKLSETYTYERYTDEPPISTDYVITSAVNAYSGPETYVFPTDSEGGWLSAGELPGSFRGALDHDAAIAGFCAEV